MTWPFFHHVPLLKDVKTQAPEAICECAPTTAPQSLVNRDKPPFDNADLRKAFRAGDRSQGLCSTS